ncbi:MAG TPA: PilZ domain-containing protein [Rhizomicrobium sp.]|jgi:hypothetical protein|nr:PilZ domain-containing protein [Rhizomicrobium sp.]
MTHNIRRLRRPATVSGRRARANFPMALKAGPERVTGRVVDISPQGARVSVPMGLNLESNVWIVMEHVPPIKGVIVWRGREFTGVKFRDQQDWVQEDFRSRFDPTNWLTRGQNPL